MRLVHLKVTTKITINKKAKKIKEIREFPATEDLKRMEVPKIFFIFKRNNSVKINNKPWRKRISFTRI
jgi:hypothetical protein